jgi:chaperonin GroES
MSKLRPLNGNVVLKKVEESEQTYGQIVIPDMGKEKPELGEVVATSPTFNWHKGEPVPSGLRVGQFVLIPKMGAMAFSIDTEDYIVIRESEVLAIVNKEK